LLFKSKWDTLSVLNIENEKYFVSKNCGAAPLTVISMYITEYPFLFIKKKREKKNPWLYSVFSGH
jgi:hypothetical protein